MSTLGIVAAVKRACAIGIGDYWGIHLDAAIIRTAYFRNCGVTPDEADAWAMRRWTRYPQYSPRRRLAK
jgi:hypothetical protein